VGMERSDVCSKQVGGDIAWLWSVVMWKMSKLGDIACGRERRDVGFEQVGCYSVVMERSDMGSEQVWGDTAWVWIVVMLAVSKWGDITWVWTVV
jgi:hypothetical protein